MDPGLIESKYRPMAEQAAFFCDGLEGKTVLDVGCDKDGALISLLVKEYGVKEAVGVNPFAVQVDTLPNQCSVIKGDITKSLFPGNYFDVILSLAAFEHIQSLDTAFAEMYRVLKPGGLLYSRFGPIWSSCWGHHLWVVHEGMTYNYMNTILPAFCHLISSQDEVMTYCLERHDAQLSRRIVDYVFYSPEQNRLFYEDYVRILRSSSFKVLSFHDMRDLDMLKRYLHGDYANIHRKVRARHPLYDRFDCQSIAMLLDKA